MVREVDTVVAARRTDAVGTMATPLEAVATAVGTVEAEEVPHTALTRCRACYYKQRNVLLSISIVLLKGRIGTRGT